MDLDAGTVEVLRRHQARQAELRESMGEAYEDRGRVFADPYGGWASPQRLLKAVKEYGRRAGQPSMSVRSLRHFHASLLHQSWQNVVVVSKRLGHSAVSITTDVYAHSLPGWQKQAAEAFAAAMEERSDTEWSVSAGRSLRSPSCWSAGWSIWKHGSTTGYCHSTRKRPTGGDCSTHSWDTATPTCK